MHGSGSLSVETHGLGERLSNNHLEALVKEVLHSVAISLEVSTGEALVGSVEVWEKIIFLHHSGDFMPLLWGWVNTSWIVGACVEENDRAWLSVGEILD